MSKARLAQLEHHQRDINDAIDGVDNGSKGSDESHDVTLTTMVQIHQ